MYNILLVDDESLIRHAIRSLENWEEWGFHFAYEASNGKNALKILEHSNVDLVLTDIKMPVMDGIEFLENAKKTNCEIPFIMLSAYNDFETVRKAFKLGAQDYIVKTKMDGASLISIFCSVLGEIPKAVAKKQHEGDNQVPLSDNQRRAIKMAIDYIHLNYMNPISLSVISEHCQLSIGYFCNFFSKEMGISFVEYLSNIRIKYAEELLKTTSMKVYQVAETVGFNSTEHFCRVFKKTTGKSPRIYKETADTN